MTKPKHKVFIILTLIFTLITTSCALWTEDEPEEMKVAVLNYTSDDIFINTVNEKLLASFRQREEYLASEGIDLQIYVDTFSANSSQITQTQQVERLVQQNYDVLLVNIVDRTRASQIIELSRSNDIPVIFFNREPVSEDLDTWNNAYYIGTSARNEGKLQGEILVELLDENFEEVDKNNDGIIQYLLIEGEVGHQDAILRSDVSVETVNNAGYQTEMLDRENADWLFSRAYSMMSAWIDEFPEEVEVIISNNDDMAVGAIKALEDSDNDYYRESAPIILGMDATPDGLAAIKSGKMYGTVVNDAVNIASTLVDLAIYLAEDITIANEILDNNNDDIVRIPNRIVTAENIEEELELAKAVK